MVTKLYFPFIVSNICYSLAKIQMVTKRPTILESQLVCYSLAKIQMVTKPVFFCASIAFSYSLAKIQMVTKPQIYSTIFKLI